MILKIGFVVLVCIAAAADASVLRRQLEKKEVPDPEYGYYELDYVSDDPIKNLDWERALEPAMESLYHGAMGFQDNLIAFATKVEEVLLDYVGNYYKALLPVVEAVPAETLKEAAINILKAVSSVIEKLAVVIKERNPLHPQISPYETSNIIARDLDELTRQVAESEVMTLTIWGKNVGKLIGAVDDLLVDLVAALAEKMKEADSQLQVMTEQLESVPASMIKNIVVQSIRQKATMG